MAYLAHRFLTPGDELHIPGGLSYIVSVSLGQARRTSFRSLRMMIGDSEDYTVNESTQQANITHRDTGTRIEALPANHKTAQGLLGVRFLIGDEPGAWEINGGQQMADAIEEGQGKPGDDMKIIYIGTLGPNALHAGHWYYDLVTNGHDPDEGRYVMAYMGDRRKWNRKKEIARVNPVMWNFPNSRRKLMRRLKQAKSNPSKKASFLTYRLNQPTADETEVLLTVDQWEDVLARVPQPKNGHPVIGIDMGSNRAWSAVVAFWESQRIEAFAICPGIPSIAEQEERDGVPFGAYQKLIDEGLLIVADGQKQPPAFMIVQEIARRFGSYVLAVSDLFRFHELEGAGLGAGEVRRTRYSEADADIRALRRAALDGMLSVDESANLFGESLAATMVIENKHGNLEMQKKGKHNQGRDDVSAALKLAAGAAERLWGPYGRPVALPIVMQLG
ncbi:MAG: hypothetical protein OXC68_04320 [Aestuariivita sp.]|nr:hypothetical protein [Aestuariivita sp.]